MRAIRSYVGANSGPLTQRTHLMYRERTDVVTDLRVHAIPAIMDFLDYSAAAQGMTYRSSTLPGGVAIDGVQDAVPGSFPTWEAANGAPGPGVHRQRGARRTPRASSRGRSASTGTRWRRPRLQCWGDGSYFGASGSWVQAEIPNTDPRTTPFSTLTSSRVTQFGPPAADPAAPSRRRPRPGPPTSPPRSPSPPRPYAP